MKSVTLRRTPPGVRAGRRSRPASSRRPPKAIRCALTAQAELACVKPCGGPCESAGNAVAVSPAVGSRWFREAGAMPSVSQAPLSGRYLLFAEREEITFLLAGRRGVREIARRLGRSPSTVSRELRRNAATRGGLLEYRATPAQRRSDRRARRPKAAKLATNDALRAYVQDRLAGAISTRDGAPVPGPQVCWIGRRHGPQSTLGDVMEP